MTEDGKGQMGITFTDIAAGDDAGIAYRRAESPHNANAEQLKQMPVVTMADLMALQPGNRNLGADPRRRH